jgi:hypothetical protein
MTTLPTTTAAIGDIHEIGLGVSEPALSLSALSTVLRIQP